ncbi:WEB family protein - chloroplastic [Striga hermonthica]|uniref:WEB family protein - chloroplastic n=1 Tax=Striga hermonthica TaxID=68872 RepID=A0A9N7MWC7_STRHE|nr:WEB family protein - chloroplastic [Striga hermonthica]
MKQLEGSNDSLHEAEAEIAALKEKIGLLEISIRSQKKDLEEVGHCFEEAKAEASEMGKEVESLKSELEMVKEEKNQSLNNEKLAAASVMTLLEDKNKLINELGISRDEEEKSKKALESLASALHEVSSEARDAKEKLLSIQVEQENYESQIEDLKLVLKATNEKYESMLEEARLEIEDLTGSIQDLRRNHESSKAEWEQKELHLTNTVKKSGEEKSSMENEINRLINLLRASEEQVSAARDECVSWKNSLKEAESEAVYLKEVLGEAKAESMKLKEGLMDRENELQNVLHENEELMKREAASLEKVKELSKQLEEALLANDSKKRQEEGNGELTDSEKDYHMLPEVVEYSEQNGTMGNVKPKVVEEEKTLADDEKSIHEVENSNSKIKNENEKETSDSAEVDFKMWESCKIEEKDFSPEHESFEEDEIESKADGAERFDQVNNGTNENVDNGGNSPSKEQQSSSQKKKKPLLRKFGNLLKKKGTTTQK